MGCGTLVALGLGGAGAGLGVDAASQEQSAMNQAVQNQINAQNQYQKKGLGVFNQSLAQSTPTAMTGQQATGAQQYLDASRQAALTPLSLPSNASAALPGNQNIAYQGQQAKNQLAQGANAQLQGYGNIGLSQYLKDLQANSQLGVIGTQAQRSAQAFPTLLQGAANSSQNEASWGKILSTLGALTGVGSSVGLFGNAATPAYTVGQYGGAWDTGNFGTLGQPITDNTGLTNWSTGKF